MNHSLRSRLTPPRVALLLAALGPALWASLALSGDPAVPPGVSAPVPPAEARKTFRLAPGLDMRLVAHEPLVRQPVSITFDDRGRLWVLQYLQYPLPSGLKAVEIDQYLRTRYDR